MPELSQGEWDYLRTYFILQFSCMPLQDALRRAQAEEMPPARSVIYTIMAIAAWVCIPFFVWGFIFYRWWMPLSACVAAVLLWQVTPNNVRSKRWFAVADAALCVTGLLAVALMVFERIR